MIRTIVCGDIHGNIKALNQCLERSGFDKKNDILIQLGDVADGIPFVKDVVDELLTIKNLISIKGNHDEWFLEFINSGTQKHLWLSQGGFNTLRSYGYDFTHGIMNTVGELPQNHMMFFYRQIDYYFDKERNMFFTHGGFNRHFSVFDKDSAHYFTWDRDLWLEALADSTRSEKHRAEYPFKVKDNFDKVFIGHTATTSWKKTEPMITDTVINMDTGAGFNGKLTFMDVDTKEIWQSETVEELYGQKFR